MRVVCVGGGPAGLYLAILLKRADPDHQVVVLERKPRHCTDGWGVVFWDDLLDDLRATDAETARRVSERAFPWRGQHLVLEGEEVEHEGDGYAIARATLLDVLVERATDLGVEIRFDHEVAGSAELRDADVIVAADGVNSAVRAEHADEFGTEVVVGRNKYVWLGTDKVFEGFTLAFEQTEAGWMWCHSYAYGPDSSTCIVECAPETWAGLGLDALPAHDSLTLLETVFRKPLGGGRLISPAAEDAPLPWLNFKTITNSRWHIDKTVLVGDAAHTTHFSIGSGTILALRDAIALAEALQLADAPQSAFAIYEKRQRETLVPIQSNARLSARWFEQVGRYVEMPAPALFALVRARRDPVLLRVPPKLYYRLYATAERIPALRNLKRQLGPNARTLYGRLTQRAHP